MCCIMYLYDENSIYLSEYGFYFAIIEAVIAIIYLKLCNIIIINYILYYNIFLYIMYNTLYNV